MYQIVYICPSQKVAKNHSCFKNGVISYMFTYVL